MHAFAAGARAYVLKSDAEQHLISAVHSLTAGA
jgi:DNA-binding NarL/FixJ family response regulator